MKESLEPRIAYRLYAVLPRDITIVPIPNDDESCYDSTRFVSQVFYTYASAQRAWFGYRLLQGDMLLPDECAKLVQLLR